ncbi:sn-glycerol-1-phosphate dehydrogenase [Apibacter sp. HY039]|uniref:sn-glycerol-1-phosphate dehydrogenase n=1 Tax=Apibacter sp. HY039 TaxID=2501476 RepID=UPI000FEB9146|nr:sn-glycerol-1-phosphate dehydrogenase [Apibacter sp. HY039]
MNLNKINSALAYATQTQSLVIGSDILPKIPEIIKQLFPEKKAVIIADPNTFKAAGSEIEQILEKNNLKGSQSYIITDPDLYAEYRFVDQIRDFLKKDDLIPIAVGSGVINDLVKRASFELEREYVCVATADSMDGYSAYGASITQNGSKVTFSCPAPKALFADIEIIRKAPSLLTASGYGDLFAKVAGGADWILADAISNPDHPKIGVEPIDEIAWGIVQNGLHEALSDPEGAKNGDRKAIESLTNGLMLGGLAIQYMKSTRPGSGADHQFSHLWDNEHHTFSGNMAQKFGLYPNKDTQAPSHGFKVGINTLCVIALYEKLLETPVENLNIDSLTEQWHSLDEEINRVKEMYENSDILDFVIQQVTDKHVTKEELKDQLIRLKNSWPTTKEKLKKQLIPYQESKIRLLKVGAPTECEEIGITRKKLKETFFRGQKIRSRYTILDLAYRIGLLEQWVDELFDSGYLSNKN